MPQGSQDIAKSGLLPERLHAKHAERSDCPKTDLVALGIAVAAVIMLISIGVRILPVTFQWLLNDGSAPDRLLLTAFLLNIALVMLGWRRYRVLTQEIAEHRRAEGKARLLAETDALTGLLNRRSLSPAADQLFADAARQGQAVAIIMLDLDKFKQVNDGYGHAAGDALLIETANRLCRILPEGALLARIGGDEFACAMPYSPHQPEVVEELVECAIAAIARPVHFAETEIETTISAGIARHLPNSGQDARAVLHNADIAMYHAKKDGRNRHCWFKPTMEQELRRRSELEAGLRRGLSLSQFVPFYQKQVDLKTGGLTGYEMLARWQSEDFANVSPDQFIPVAEEIGLIDNLFEQVIRKALTDARTWHSSLILSVNISCHQLRNPWFAQKLLKLLIEANFPPSRLEIEIKESALLENIALVRTMITSLHNQGIRITLDDFGTGHSSLLRLRSLPFDRVKIDRSLISSIGENAPSTAIISSIVSLTESLDLRLAAEGIESADVLGLMNRMGDFRGQGSLFGKPKSGIETQAELAGLGLLNAPAAITDALTADEHVHLPTARIA